MPITLVLPHKFLLTYFARKRAFVLMLAHLMSVESICSGELFWTKIALKGRGRLLNMGEFPREGFRIWVILVHVLFEFFLTAPTNVHSCASHFGATERLFVPIRVLLKTPLVGKSFVKIEAGVSRTFVPIPAVEVCHALF